MRIYSQEKFIQKCISIFGRQYSFDNATYKNSTTKVIVTCILHGDFEITPKNLFKGQGCKQCGYIKLSNKNSSNTETFISKAKKIHGDLDSYDKTIYVNSSTKIVIQCIKHGLFEITPNNYLRGARCSKCRAEKLSSLFSSDSSVFIQKANEKWNNRWVYQKTNYVSAIKKVIITCTIHGDFLQTPANHLSGFIGCSRCQSSLGEKMIADSLANIGAKFQQQVRISNCRSKNPLPFDFGVYSNSEKLLGLIEYQGSQHFSMSKWSQKISDSVASDNFRQLQQRDKIKEEYCRKNNIPFLVIPYWNCSKVSLLIENFVESIKPT